MKIVKPYRPFDLLSEARLFARKFHPVSHIIRDPFPDGREGYTVVLDFNEDDTAHQALWAMQQKNKLSERWIFEVPEASIVEDIIP